MTSALASSLDIPAAHESLTSRRLTKAEQREELDKMVETMLEQGGFFNVAQSAISLDVSRERVYELIELGILKKFRFLGRIYLSVREVNARREADVKAGRPARTLGQRIKATLKAAAATDAGRRWPTETLTRLRRA